MNHTENEKFFEALQEILKEMSHEELLSHGSVLMYFAEELNNEVLERIQEEG